jgi:uncharacterized RDD family membrane protein YckC
MRNQQVPDDKQAARLGQYAGFVTRLIAWFIDQLLLTATISITIAVVGFIADSFKIYKLLGLGENAGPIVAIAVLALGLLLPVVYHIGFWLLSGQTIGKWLMGVCIVRTDGERMRFGNCVRRLAGYGISAIFFLGYLWILFDNRRQGFHDKFAGTYVVYSWPERGTAVRPIRDRVRRLRLQP